MFSSNYQLLINQIRYLHKGQGFFFLIFGGHESFWGATDTPVLDFWQHLPWVSKPGWIPCLHASSPACHEFLRFTSSVIPADCKEVSMAAGRVQYMLQRTKFHLHLIIVIRKRKRLKYKSVSTSVLCEFAFRQSLDCRRVTYQLLLILAILCIPRNQVRLLPSARACRYTQVY